MRAIPTLKISISVSGASSVIRFSPILLTRFAQAFGTFVGSGSIVIGRDPRNVRGNGQAGSHSRTAFQWLQVIDVGMCPVPTVQLIRQAARSSGWSRDYRKSQSRRRNALKFIGPDGLF